MEKLDNSALHQISGAKNVEHYYHDVVKPIIITGASVYAGPSGAVAATIALYGIEGLIEVAPSAIKALEKMNRLTDTELQARMNDPYRYPD